jgi:hypothetical protein
MALIFRRDDSAHDKATDQMFAAHGSMRRSSLVFLLMWIALLLAGTLKVDLLTNTYGQIVLPFDGAQAFQSMLDRLIPYDASRGEEGLSIQGVILIISLILIGMSSWKGFENIHIGFNRWTWIALTLTGLTLLIAALGVKDSPEGLNIAFTGKFFGVLLASGALIFLLHARLSKDELRDWLWESWRFVKQIFPLLVIGVFAVGIIRVLIRPEWIETLAGQSTLLGNLAGVLFGVFMYFPTLVEVPIANMFLSLGMHRGPLLAYLMADPELSLQSILIISTIIGRLKAWTYVGWVALFSALAGLIYGAWVDGAGIGLAVLYLLAFLTVLGGTLWWVSRKNNILPVAQKP